MYRMLTGKICTMTLNLLFCWHGAGVFLPTQRSWTLNAPDMDGAILGSIQLSCPYVLLTGPRDVGKLAPNMEILKDSL